MIGALAPVADPVVVGVGPARARPSPELERGGETVVVGVLPAVPDPIAIAVCASRVHPGEVFLPVGQAVAIRVLAPVGDPVAVGVHPIGAGPRPGPFPGVREAVVVRVGGSRDDRRREQARDQQHGGGNQPRTAIRATIHAPIVPGNYGRRECLGRPVPADSVVRFRLATAGCGRRGPPQSGNASGPRSLSSRASPEASSAGSHEYG